MPIQRLTRIATRKKGTPRLHIPQHRQPRPTLQKRQIPLKSLRIDHMDPHLLPSPPKAPVELVVGPAHVVGDADEERRVVAVAVGGGGGEAVGPVDLGVEVGDVDDGGPVAPVAPELGAGVEGERFGVAAGEGGGVCDTPEVAGFGRGGEGVDGHVELAVDIFALAAPGEGCLGAGEFEEHGEGRRISSMGGRDMLSWR